MATEHPVTELMNDHRLIEKVMSSLEAKLQMRGAEFPAAFVADALSFFAEFADGHHHFKEEEVLFPELAKRGVPVEGGPIGKMLYEHTMGRQLLAGIREHLAAARDGNEKAQEAVRDNAANYVGLLRQHIWKEDNILFRMARQVLDEKSAEEVLTRFHSRLPGATGMESTKRHAEFAAGLAA